MDHKNTPKTEHDIKRAKHKGYQTPGTDQDFRPQKNHPRTTWEIREILSSHKPHTQIHSRNILNAAYLSTMKTRNEDPNENKPPPNPKSPKQPSLPTGKLQQMTLTTLL